MTKIDWKNGSTNYSVLQIYFGTQKICRIIIIVVIYLFLFESKNYIINHDVVAKSVYNMYICFRIILSEH